jgi:hypothetical protein
MKEDMWKGSTIVNKIYIVLLAVAVTYEVAI